MNIKWFGWGMRVLIAFFGALATTQQTGAEGLAMWLPPVIAALTTGEAGLADLNQTRNLVP